MWERACSRKRRNSQPFSLMTHRIREQARSHRFGVGISISDKRFCLFLPLAACPLPLRLPKRAILVGQSLPPTFHCA
ncbi:hypothetical protein E1508_07205 [Pseudomonas moraviensis]|nr:hypothetical protein E1508_07205 [Pseudomonas moraviensis]